MKEKLLRWKEKTADFLNTEALPRWKKGCAAGDRLLDRVVRKSYSPNRRMLTLYLIKILYILLTVVLLTGKWYVGRGSYDVNFIFWKELIASAVFLGATFFYVRAEFGNGFLSSLIHLLYVLYYIPLNSAFGLNDAPIGFFLASNIYFLLFLAAAYWIHLHSEKRYTKTVDGAPSPLYEHFNIRLFCIIVCAIFIIHKLAYNGLSFSLSIASEDVYGNRADYQEYLKDIAGSLWSYLLSIVRNLAGVVAPFYMLISLLRKKPISFSVGCLCALSMFAVSSEKSKLLFILIAVGIYLFKRCRLLEHFPRLLEVGAVLVLLLCLVQSVTGASSIYSLLIRRQMYIPSWLNTIYYDFFSENHKVFWSQDVLLLKNLLPSFYETSPLNIISAEYFQGKVPSPNAGMFAEAFMHFGYFGTVIYPVILVGIAFFSERVFRSYGRAVETLFAITLTLKLINVPVLRTDTVLSYFLFIFVLWILPKIPLRDAWAASVKYLKGFRKRG